MSTAAPALTRLIILTVVVVKAAGAAAATAGALAPDGWQRFPLSTQAVGQPPPWSGLPDSRELAAFANASAIAGSLHPGLSGAPEGRLRTLRPSRNRVVASPGRPSA